MVNILSDQLLQSDEKWSINALIPRVREPASRLHLLQMSYLVLNSDDVWDMVMMNWDFCKSFSFTVDRSTVGRADKSISIVNAYTIAFSVIEMVHYNQSGTTYMSNSAKKWCWASLVCVVGF